MCNRPATHLRPRATKSALIGGVILQHDDEHPFTFNPFLLDKHDFLKRDNQGKTLTEGKLLHLITLLKLITGNNNDTNGLEITNTILELLIVDYYESMWKNDREDFKFDTFYDYCKGHIVIFTKEKGIPKEKFDPNVFLFLLEKYYADGPRGNLLNKQDNRISNLSDEKVVYFKLGKLIDNELLFPITALMIMNIFNKKMHDPTKLSINKILAVDEAWKALVRPELVHYFNSQSRMARKL